MYPVITISREKSSHGHDIGKEVAARLEIPFLDKDFIEEVSGATGLTRKEVEKEGETASYMGKYFSSSFYNGLYLGDDQDRIFQAQKKIILDYARKGPCVIVGRCADDILSKTDIPHLNVLIHAPLSYRIANYQKQFGGTQQQVEKLLTRQDKGRQFYYRCYTDREWGCYANYHLSLDSQALGETLCADLIIQAAKNFENR